MTALTPDSTLKQEAHWLYRSIQQSVPAKAMEARARVETFVPRINNRLQCPRCWVGYGSRAPLTPIDSGSDAFDVARCDGCAVEIVLPI